MTYLVSAAIASPIGVTVAMTVVGTGRQSTAVTRPVGSRLRTGLRTLEKQDSDEGGDARHHAKSNNHIAQATRPSNASIAPFSEKVS